MKIKLLRYKDSALTQSLLAGMTSGAYRIVDSDLDLDHVIVSGGTEADWHRLVAQYGAHRVSLITDDPRPNPPTRSAWSSMPCVGWLNQRVTVPFPIQPRWHHYKTKEICLPDRLGQESRLEHYQTSLAIYAKTIEPLQALEAISRGCLPLSPQWHQSSWPDWPGQALTDATEAFLNGHALRQVWGEYIIKVYWPMEAQASSRIWIAKWRQHLDHH